MTTCLASLRRRPAACPRRPRPGYTLVELLVVVVILATLASLSLSGLAGAARRGKIERTKSTIRKLNEIVMSQYEGYLRRRVAITPTPSRVAAAQSRLRAIRTLMAQELPDQWADVYATVGFVPSNATGPTRAYAAYRDALNSAGNPNWTSRMTAYQSSECLWMIVNRGGLSADMGADQFRDDEQGDIDKDGALEFWDGWGRPIAFIRWPAGFASVVQSRSAASQPDPFDPLRISGTSVAGMVNFPSGSIQRDYALVPLIYSPGPDEATNDPLSASSSGYGIHSGTTEVSGSNAVDGRFEGWIRTINLTIATGTLTTRFHTSGTRAAGTILDAAAAADNIFNHDLMKK